MARDNALRFTFSTVPSAWSSVTLNVGQVHTANTPAVAPPNGTVVTFANIGTGAGGGIAANTTFFVVNSTGVSFGLSTVPGGAPLTIGTASGAIAMATVNLSPVVTTLGGRSAQIKLPTGPSGHWTAAYSDALNVTRFRTTIADMSVITSQVTQSAIVGDSPLQGSTAGAGYFLRASIGVAGMFGPAPCQLTVQGNGVNSATAPVPGDPDWAQVSTIGSCPANASALTITTSNATGGFTIRAGTALVGQTFTPHTNAANLIAGIPYLVGPSNTLYNVNGSALTGIGTPVDVSGYVGSFASFGTFNTASGAVGSTSLLFDTLPPAGSALVFLTVTASAGFSTNTVYYVVASPINGQVGLSATFGGAPITVTTNAVAAGTGFFTDIGRQPYVFVSNTVTGNVLQAVSAAGGTQIAPHGLKVGDVVFLSLGSAAGTPALVTDQAYYVTTIPSHSTFTVSATINGPTAIISGATSAVFAPVRTFKIVNAMVDKTIRPWMRVAFTHQNLNYLQTGYATILFADLAVGRDNSAVN